ncbi:MAG: formate--tetrahydrofolate ligase [Candidatus Hydrogenedentes bacterium]|nr:formate--tetrahydrofolate ligase [Candidatus Hydrogenedentota bacterium]
MLTDLEIARKAALQPVQEIAAGLGLTEDELHLYGKYRAKVSLDVLERLKDRPNGKYIDVTALTPTPLGEGKTVTTVGLGLGLNRIGKKGIVCLRQPSMGPTFGIKGGAAGGGYAQVVPMEEFNLHLTGDIHAVEIAHNLLAAMIDNHIHHGNALDLDPHQIAWRRVVDVSDRALRNIVLGLGGSAHGVPREGGFDITVASELMAILALADGLQDLRQMMGRIVVGRSRGKAPVTAEDLKAAGAMTVLLKEAIMPTLMQTTENTPVFVHTGPFANIAHGNSSVLADKIALKLGDYVVTESGFGADMGWEKFANIKCRYGRLKPDAAVLVATVRALKMHSGEFTVKAGKPLDDALTQENLEAIRRGARNLTKQIENVLALGTEVVVAVNRFPTDTERELALVQELALEANAAAAVVSDVHARGGEGGAALAEKVVEVAERGSRFRFLYPLEAPIKEKIHTIATAMYGADGVTYERDAQQQIEWLTEHGFDHLPICMAKTQLSLSHDASLKGRPAGFKIPVREVRASIGAGFLIPVCGNIMLMPGLPSVPGATRIDIDKDGEIVGLF